MDLSAGVSALGTVWVGIGDIVVVAGVFGVSVCMGVLGALGAIVAIIGIFVGVPGALVIEMAM